MLTAYPFLLPVIGGFFAGCSAVLLRRAGTLLGRRLTLPGLAAALASMAAFGWSVYWAWTSSGAEAPFTVVPLVTGWGLMLGGGMLAGWSLRVRGWRPRRVWRPDRDEQRQPYRSIRRPIVAGLAIAGLGLGVLADRWEVWVCLAAVFAAWSVILELADWEQRLRLPACRDYLRRTPRYLPGTMLRRRSDSA